MVSAVMHDWSLGRLLYKGEVHGHEWSHLCGTKDCCRSSHLDHEGHDANRSRIEAHAWVQLDITEKELLGLEERCQYGKEGGAREEYGACYKGLGPRPKINLRVRLARFKRESPPSICSSVLGRVP